MTPTAKNNNRFICEAVVFVRLNIVNFLTTGLIRYDATLVKLKPEISPLPSVWKSLSLTALNFQLVSGKSQVDHSLIRSGHLFVFKICLKSRWKKREKEIVEQKQQVTCPQPQSKSCMCVLYLKRLTIASWYDITLSMVFIF